jgi:hypothetical protein
VEANEAAEIIREAGEHESGRGLTRDRLTKVTALLTAVLATMLAFATISTGATTRKQLNTNIHLTDLHSNTDVTTLRQSDIQIAGEMLQSIIDTTNPPADVRSAMEQRVAGYQATAKQLDGDERAGTGIKGAEAQISSMEGLESKIETQILSFEYSEVVLQVGIVLASVAILAGSRGLFYTCCGFGVLGGLLILNGFTLFTNLPSIH